MNPVLRRRTLLPLSLAGLWSCAQPVVPALRRVDLQGHRGARGLAPENTLVMEAVASAMPSITPTASAEAPNAVTR